MSKPVSLSPPSGFEMSIHAGAGSAMSATQTMSTDFRGVAVYNWFTLRLRRIADNTKPEFRAELVYRTLTDRVVLTAIIVEPLQLEVDEALAELRSVRTLDWWKRYALTAIADKFTREVFDPNGPYVLAEDNQAVEVAAVRLATSSMPLARRSNRIDDKHLDEVARIYTEAWKANRNPTQAVEQGFRTTYSTAARWVGLARKGGKLGPPVGPHGGTWDT